VQRVIGKRFRLQRLNRRLSVHEFAQHYKFSTISLNKFERGEWRGMLEATLLRLMRLERAWAFEEVRRALFGVDYALVGTLVSENMEEAAALLREIRRTIYTTREDHHEIEIDRAA